jgi:SAC3 family protein LENG8/THP3
MPASSKQLEYNDYYDSDDHDPAEDDEEARILGRSLPSRQKQPQQTVFSIEESPPQQTRLTNATAMVQPQALVGTNTALEKPYLRLTDFPRASDVRPLPVLIRALQHVKARYVQTEDYDWTNEQLKSIRQDLTVQQIRHPFVLEVYETHARINLEHGDLNEFNQCQTMIRSLTTVATASNDGAEDLAGSSIVSVTDDREPLRQSDAAMDEFLAYGLLYSLVRNSWSEMKQQLTRIQSLFRLVQRKHAEEQHRRRRRSLSLCSLDDDTEGRNSHHTTDESSCAHAFRVVSAVLTNDYRSFFRLYRTAPHLSAYVMDFLVKRVRDEALECVLAAYRPFVSVEHIRACLSFPDLTETREYLGRRGGIIYHSGVEPSLVCSEVEGSGDSSSSGARGGTSNQFYVDCKASTVNSVRDPV